MNCDHKSINYKLKSLLLAAFFVFILSILPSYALFGGKIDSFSADNVEIGPNGKIVNTSKIYMTPDAMRMDGMPGQGSQGMPKMNISLLVLKKQDKQYFYNHDKKLVFESEVDEDISKAGYKGMDNIESEKVLGKEKVSGYKCVKKEVLTSNTVMGMTDKTKLLVWESDKFEFPLRTQNEDGTIQEMRNIKTGKPSKKFFKPTSGYKKVDNMMAVMGMDFGAMMKEDKTENDDEKDSQAPPQNIENIDVAQMMEGMKKALGENADPEQMKQMEQMMAQVMAQVKQTSTGKGATDRLWKIIPKRPGDQIGSELKTPYVITVVMGTTAKLNTVFTFYQNKLKPKGWKDGGMHLQNDRGSMHMLKGDQSLSVSWSENPGMQGNYTLFYNIQLQGPDI